MLIIVRKKATKVIKVKKITKKKSVPILYVIRRSFFLFGSIASVFILVVVGASAIVVHLSPKPTQPPCANTATCLGNLSGKISNNTKGTYMGKSVSSPDQNYFAQATGLTNVLGDSTGVKHVYIDLSAQRLYAFQGSTMVFNDSVATGKWNLTPTGTFQVWIKLQATLMAGGEGATSYYLPNVPWTMYFYNASIPKSAGYSMHGEYWYNPDIGLGRPQSHGCINMRISDAKALYDWIDPPTTGYTTYATPGNPGTLVTISGATPNSGLIGTRFYNNNTSFDAGTAL